MTIVDADSHRGTPAGPLSLDSLAGRRVVVVGLGRSGLAAARRARQLGAWVVGADDRPVPELESAVGDALDELAPGGVRGAGYGQADLVIVSPGIPPVVEFSAAESRGVEVIGELEFAARQLPAPLVCVGGTNGKSTVTTVLGDIAGRGLSRVFVGGNLGVPLTEAIGQDWDLLVVEVSSFQLERAPRLRPRVSILLNVTDDHLDRYSGFEDYAHAKGNAFINQGAADAAVIPLGDGVCAAQAKRGGGRVLTFGSAGADFEVSGRRIVERATGVEWDLEGTRFHGHHNLTNAASAVAAARWVGLEAGPIADGLRGFQPLPHRMALVANSQGITYYDDSKATNVGSAVTALSGLAEERGVLIAGGRDKLGDYAPLVQACQKKARAVVLIGEAAERIEAALGGTAPVVRAGSIGEAVRVARAAARHGDAVLLSPACSSFDMFRSYADRGDQFAAAVRELVASEARTPVSGAISQGSSSC